MNYVSIIDNNMNICKLIIALAVLPISFNVDLAAENVYADEVLVIDPDERYEVYDPDFTSEADVEQSQNDVKGEIFAHTDELPEFIGGQQALISYLCNEIRYPEQAIKDKIEGRVVVRFVVDQLGRVCDPTVVHGVRSDLDEEAIRVVRNMPLWLPGRIGGEPVNCYFLLPVNYRFTPQDEQIPPR